MKLQATIGTQQHEITLRRDGARVSAKVDGRVYELEARFISTQMPNAKAPVCYLLQHEGRVFEALAQGAHVTIKGHEYAITLTDPKRPRAGSGTGLEKSGQLTAQMPGKVVRLLVAVGAEVAKDTPVLVVEAMKMQNELKAPRDGVVTALKVAPGDTVNAGDVLAVVE